MDDVLDNLQQHIADQIAEGFYTREEIIDEAADYAEDEFERVDLDSFIEMTVNELFEAHYQLQATWEYPTDCDRLDMAFAEMDIAGIVARQNFTCCQTCGHAEMQGEIASVQQHRPVAGYVFYHVQDTESAREGHGLYLAYGAVQEGEEALVQLGWQIVEMLKDTGLEVSWDGNTNKRIYVEIDWKCRHL
jgi:hypothetical protein